LTVVVLTTSTFYRGDLVTSLSFRTSSPLRFNYHRKARLSFSPLLPLCSPLFSPAQVAFCSFLPPSLAFRSSAGPFTPPPSRSTHHPLISLILPTMTAVNMHMMSTGMPLDFLPQHQSHSRSASVSSSSTHSSHSRPQSSQGGYRMQQPGAAPSAEDLYRASYHLGHQSLMQHGEVRSEAFYFFLLLFFSPVFPSAASKPQYHESCAKGWTHASQSHPRTGGGVALPARYRQRSLVIQRNRGSFDVHDFSVFRGLWAFVWWTDYGPYPRRHPCSGRLWKDDIEPRSCSREISGECPCCDHNERL